MFICTANNTTNHSANPAVAMWLHSRSVLWELCCTLKSVSCGFTQVSDKRTILVFFSPHGNHLTSVIKLHRLFSSHFRCTIRGHFTLHLEWSDHKWSKLRQGENIPNGSWMWEICSQNNVRWYETIETTSFGSENTLCDQPTYHTPTYGWPTEFT